MEKLKAFGKWLYNWATVVASVIFGGLATVLDLLDAFDVVDWTAILPPEHAAKIILAVALLKAIHAFSTRSA